jgi:hypothetical protein
VSAGGIHSHVTPSCCLGWGGPPARSSEDAGRELSRPLGDALQQIGLRLDARKAPLDVTTR